MIVSFRLLAWIIASTTAPVSADESSSEGVARANDVVIADWPSWRGPNRDGISPEAGWSSQGAGEPLWSRDVGRGYSSVAVSGGRLYTRGFYVSEGEAPPAKEEGEKPKVPGTDVTVCLDANTGDELWRHESPSILWDNMHRGGTMTTPVVAGETVYVLGRMGTLFAHDAESGIVWWERELTEVFDAELGFFGISSSPLVLGEVVYLNVGKSVALDTSTGETLWETRDYGYSYATPVAFSWQGRPLLAVFNAVGLVVLDRATGVEVAKHDWTSNYNVNSATPIVIADQIFISTGYDALGCALLKLSDEGLEVVWSSRAMNNKMNGCVYVDGAFYGFDDGKLKCIDIAGEERWMYRGLGKGSLIASDQRLVVLSEEGELLVGPISQESFEPEYRSKVIETEDFCWTNPVLASGLIYCRDSAGKLVCLDHRRSAE